MRESYKKETLMENRRAELGIDGDHAFALLGDNIQEGEVEFVAIPNWPTSTLAEKLSAAKQAFLNLQRRLGRNDFSFFFGRSHPYGD